MKVTFYFTSSEVSSWKAKPKLEELPLAKMFRRFFENSYTVDTHQKF